MRQTDIAIVGGGVAGAAAALALARAGRSVTILERTAPGTPKVCGEFLSRVALDELAELGISAGASGALPIGRVRLAARGDPVSVALPFAAASLTRARLDGILLAKAADAGAAVEHGVTVREVTPDACGYRLATDRAPLATRHLLLACGKRDLKTHRRAPGIQNDLVGLKIYVTLDPEAEAMLGDAVELLLFPGGYCGVQRVEGGRVNVCLVIRAQGLRGLGGGAEAFAALQRASPRAQRLLAGARVLSERPLAVAHLPYGFVRRTTDGPYFLGDQAAVIPSFCGEGIGLALVSARAAATALRNGEDAASYQRAFARRVWPRVQGAALLSQALCITALQPTWIAFARAAPWLAPAIFRATRTPTRPAISAAQGTGAPAASR